MKATTHNLWLLLRQALLVLRVNFRTPLAVIYGYALPILFLLGFSAIFSSGTPPMLHEMGQLLTITILGSAALGLPTTLVAERERGVWRRHRLLPAPPWVLLGGAIAARLVIVGGAVVLQLAAARLMFGTPLPGHPAEFALAAFVSTFAFLGIGLVIAALADSVPSVQALGQCVFLPMILVGGVGVPLAVLPGWAQQLAGFMPGRYSVAALQWAVSGETGPVGYGFALLALASVGLAATAVGMLLFRWDSGERAGRQQRLGAGLALAAWLGVGILAATTGRLQTILQPGYEWQNISDTQIAGITYDDLPGDNDFITRLAPPLPKPPESARLEAFAARLDNWSGAAGNNPGEAIRHFVCLASIADLGQDPQEGEFARLVFDYLCQNYQPADLRRGLAWVVLCPDDGTVVTSAPGLGLQHEIDANAVRKRAPFYARKFLGRITGSITQP
jgi:ABC-2 type transport system permease protein